MSTKRISWPQFSDYHHSSKPLTYVQVPPAEVSTSSKKGSPTRLSRVSGLSKMQDYVYRKLILTIRQDLFLYLYGDTVVCDQAVGKLESSERATLSS